MCLIVNNFWTWRLKLSHGRCWQIGINFPLHFKNLPGMNSPVGVNKRGQLLRLLFSCNVCWHWQDGDWGNEVDVAVWVMLGVRLLFSCVRATFGATACSSLLILLKVAVAVVEKSVKDCDFVNNCGLFWATGNGCSLPRFLLSALNHASLFQQHTLLIQKVLRSFQFQFSLPLQFGSPSLRRFNPFVNLRQH